MPLAGIGGMSRISIMTHGVPGKLHTGILIIGMYRNWYSYICQSAAYGKPPDKSPLRNVAVLIITSAYRAGFLFLTAIFL